MRQVVLLLPLLLLAGCTGTASEPTRPADLPADEAVETAEPDGPAELGSMGFTLGPMGNTALTSTSAVLAVAVPNGTVSVVVAVEFETGATVDFAATGLEGCEIRLGTLQQTSGTVVSRNCAPAPGTYTLSLAHTTGHTRGQVRVSASANSGDSA